MRAGYFFIPTLIFIANLYIYNWIGRLARPPRGVRRFVLFTLFFLLILLPVTRVWAAYDFNGLNRFLTFLAQSWVGFSFLLVLCAAGTDLVFLVLRLARLSTGVSPARSLYYRRLLAAFCIAACAGLGGYGFWQARQVGVTRVDVPLRLLPPGLDGMTVVQLSDVHYGMLHENGRLTDVVRRVNELRPDWIVFTGDLVDAGVSHMEEMGLPLSRLEARQGVLAVMGNHEVFAGLKRVEDIMRGAGIQVLRNEVKVLPGGLQVMGIDDPRAAGQGLPLPDFDGLLRGLDPGKPSILLYHQPLRFEEAARAGVGLQLSGHIHGPQLWPMIPLVKIFYSYLQGLHRIGESYLYVSRGVGTGGPPMRLGSLPEIVHLTLRAPK